jgi:hypothetical protein
VSDNFVECNLHDVSLHFVKIHRIVKIRSRCHLGTLFFDRRVTWAIYNYSGLHKIFCRCA